MRLAESFRVAFGALRSRVRFAAALSIAVSSFARAPSGCLGAAAVRSRSRVAVGFISLRGSFAVKAR